MNRRSFFRTLGAAVVGAMIGVGLKPIERAAQPQPHVFSLDEYKDALHRLYSRPQKTIDILTDRETANAIQKALQAYYAAKYSVSV